MNSSFEQTLVEVWRQVHVENADAAELGTERYPVRRTPNEVYGRWISFSIGTRFVGWAEP